MSEQIKDSVLHIVNTLENGFNDELNIDGNEFTSFDYLTDCLDIQWILNHDKTFKGARVLVAYGGPNIWINTATNQVEGYWWGDKCIMTFNDNVGLNDALCELFIC